MINELEQSVICALNNTASRTMLTRCPALEGVIVRQCLANFPKFNKLWILINIPFRQISNAIFYGSLKTAF